MTLLIKQFFNFVKLLNSDKGTNQIAAGIVCGMILGFTPAFSLQTILVLICLFFFRIQIGAALGTAVFFKLLAFLLDPLFNVVGSSVLEIGALRPLFTSLYNMPIVPMTRFNNSIVMGAGIVAVVLAVPVFFASGRLIALYRQNIVARFEKTRLWKALAATSLYQWYAKYDQLHG